jgi:hypothetical protein
MYSGYDASGRVVGKPSLTGLWKGCPSPDRGAGLHLPSLFVWNAGRKIKPAYAPTGLEVSASTNTLGNSPPGFKFLTFRMGCLSLLQLLHSISGYPN